MLSIGKAPLKIAARTLTLIAALVSVPLVQAELKELTGAPDNSLPKVPLEAMPKEMMTSGPLATVPTASHAVPKTETPQKLQALVQLHTAEELRSLLSRAEQIANGEAEYNTDEPIALVLHGQEIEIFKRSNYRDNKELVDLAARLDAFNVVDLKVCQRWMGENNLSEGDLPPFLEAVPFGGDEVRRLQGVGYAFF